MTHKMPTLVRETTTTGGTGTLTLAGAVTGHRTFTAALDDGDTIPYCIVSGAGYEWGIGTFTASGTTLARTIVRGSSNSGSAVSWGTERKQIWCPVDEEDFLTPYRTQTDSLGGEQAGDIVWWNGSDEWFENLRLGNEGANLQAGSDSIAWGPKNKYDATAAPGVNDDVTLGYGPGSIIVDVTNNQAHVCVDGADGAAVWKQMTT